jgi:hypothetical protein
MRKETGMFPSRFFCNRAFAPRYFPKVGATIAFLPEWAANSNQIVGPVAPQPVSH